MSLRAEHLQGLMRDVQYNQRIIRLFVLDQLVDLIDIYVGPDEREKLQEFYEGWVLGQGGNYSEFKKILMDAISGIELPKLAKYRFDVYLEYLFPPPMPA